MDKRWYERTRISISVAIHYAPLGLVMGKTLDIGSKGMFVETKYIILPTDEKIRVSFSSPLLQRGKSTTVEAMVVHSSERGAGLFFEDFQFHLTPNLDMYERQIMIH